MTRDEAEAMLREYAAVAGDRDPRVRAAVEAGISKNRVHHLTGIGRTTIDRILLFSDGPAPAPSAGDPS
jgi:hypothetical protein